MKFNKKYEPLFNIDKYPEVRYVIVQGSRASGKSTVISQWQHDISFQSPHVILNTRFTMASARDSVIAEMNKTLEQRESTNIFHAVNNTIVNQISGAKIIFKGIKAGSLSQTANLKSITDLNIWVVDEAEELTDESTFDDADDSIRRVGFSNVVILVLNSHHITKEHFIYQRFFADKGVNWDFNGVKNEVMYIHTNYLDNWVNLSDSYKKKIKLLKYYYDKYKDEDKAPRNLAKYIKKYKYNFLGLLRSKAEGVVFENWSFGDFVNNHKIRVFGLDFGVRDYDALVQVYYNRKENKLYLKEWLYQNGLSTKELINQFKLLGITGNDVIIADSQAARTIKDIKLAGFYVKPVKKPGVTESVKEFAGFEIIIEGQNLGREFNNYVWADKVLEVPVDKDNHAIDASRYGFTFAKKI